MKPTNQRDWHSCRRKRAFSKEQVKAEKRHSEQMYGVKMKSYSCNECGKYHLAKAK